MGRTAAPVSADAMLQTDRSGRFAAGLRPLRARSRRKAAPTGFASRLSDPNEDSLMILQRIFALALLAVCAALAVMAWPYQAAFSYEPVGPRAYPLLMLGLMGLGLLYLVFRPTPIVRKDDEPELDRETL